MKKIVVIGGGTGNFVVLSGIKKFDFEINAIVSMTDSGGSTGRLRDQLGVLPPGDLRQCLVALSEASGLWRSLFLYRFEIGDLKGHNFGNLLLTALEKVTGDYQEVVDTASYILKTKGKVIPVTLNKVSLCVKYADGSFLQGEDLIDNASEKTSNIVSAYLQPKADANPHALEAISHADYIIISPGDLYTSLIPNLIVESISNKIVKSRAKIIMIMNLMTKTGQTANYSAADHVRDLEKYLDKQIDYIIMNSGIIDKKILSYYQRHGEAQVKDDLKTDKRVIREDLLDQKINEQSASDVVKRSLLRHDSKKIGILLDKLIKKDNHK